MTAILAAARLVPRAAAVALSLGLAEIAAGCSATRVVDGWELGGVEACADTPFGGDNTIPCDVQMGQILAVAGARLDERDPGHPAVLRTEIHGLGSRNAGGVNGVTVVVVFELADGGARAIGVRHRQADPGWMTVDYGPMLGEAD